jgi:hypothetical protein
MTYITPGDLLITHSGAKYIAASPDYVRTIGSVDDVESFTAVNVIGSNTGKLGWLRLADVTTVSKKDR